MKTLLKLVKKKKSKKAFVSTVDEESGTQYSKLPNVPPLSTHESTFICSMLDLFR